ncbi:hypothetical protein [Methylococcus mesophilus]|uniref:hypothetical protein n=1 Tax=Methylococcus mesophilus TaxID=2993564 RepID=UPI00224B0C4B|nr:hypothetical protein [Methylococcus mesophilus]UZR29780.1 hypothetical protein OOT43_03845 [Methylococcus mesophilus]
MPYTQVVPATNRLLAAIPEKNRQRLLANCETVELGVANVLRNPGDPIRHAYFPTGSVISLVLPVDCSNRDAGVTPPGQAGNWRRNR